MVKSTLTRTDVKNRILKYLSIGLLLASSTFQVAHTFAQTDAEVRKTMIQQSIAEYPGNCPCPYNSASNGSRCGGRSAWSRSGGYAPLCYDADITDEMVQSWQRRHSN